MQIALNKKERCDSLSPGGEWLNQKQLAAAMGVCLTTVKNWVRQGCPVVFIGEKKTFGKGSIQRFDLAEVKAWLKTRSANAAKAARATDGKGVEA